MELKGYNIGPTLKKLAEKHNYTPVEDRCVLKLTMYLDRCKDLKTPPKTEKIFNDLFKIYLLELCFRKKFFGLLKNKRSAFIEREIYDLPEEINDQKELIDLSEFLSDKNHPIKRKTNYSRTYLPQDILKLLSE